MTVLRVNYTQITLLIALFILIISPNIYAVEAVIDLLPTASSLCCSYFDCELSIVCLICCRGLFYSLTWPEQPRCGFIEAGTFVQKILFSDIVDEGIEWLI